MLKPKWLKTSVNKNQLKESETKILSNRYCNLRRQLVKT